MGDLFFEGDAALFWVSAVCLAAFVRLLLLRRSALARTSLAHAWRWLLISVIPIALMQLCHLNKDQIAPGVLNGSEWLAGVMLMTAPIAVLGARRPGARAWPWFVVLPLIIVLLWPAVSELLSNRGREPLTAGTPALMGFVIAGLMGFGNFFGTRNTLSAMFYFTAVAFPLLPVAGYRDQFWLSPLFSAPALLVSGLLADHRYQTLVQVPKGSAFEAANRLWLIFRDFFGIVWAKRVMDRMNLFAARERWTVTLTLDGFLCGAVDSSLESCAVDNAAMKRPVETLVWLLRRFADTEWLQEQLDPFGTGATTETIDV
ncbi:MAG: hypothetical protein JNL58_19895 [Planctomyces sp.]|nr:hypothetical protein [Planctomyces sp.]